MSGDLKAYRKNAETCEKLADEADKPEHARIPRNLAKQWRSLAVDLERAEMVRSRVVVNGRKARTNKG
jgi:hypothetical protein